MSPGWAWGSALGIDSGVSVAVNRGTVRISRLKPLRVAGLTRRLVADLESPETARVLANERLERLHRLVAAGEWRIRVGRDRGGGGTGIDRVALSVNVVLT